MVINYLEKLYLDEVFGDKPRIIVDCPSVEVWDGSTDPIISGNYFFAGRIPCGRRCVVFYVDGKIAAFSESGVRIQLSPGIFHGLRLPVGARVVFDGYILDKKQSMNHLINQPMLLLVDMITLQEYLSGSCDKEYYTRYNIMKDVVAASGIVQVVEYDYSGYDQKMIARMGHMYAKAQWGGVMVKSYDGKRGVDGSPDTIFTKKYMIQKMCVGGYGKDADGAYITVSYNGKFFKVRTPLSDLSIGTQFKSSLFNRDGMMSGPYSANIMFMGEGLDQKGKPALYQAYLENLIVGE